MGNEISMTRRFSRENPAKTINSKKIMKTLKYLSLPYLFKRFKLNRAAHLLRTTDFTMNQIAYIVDFKDQDQLENAFLEEYGMTPNYYRQRYNTL